MAESPKAVRAPGAWVLVVIVGSFLVGFAFTAAVDDSTASSPLALAVLVALGLPAIILGSIRFARALR